MTSGLATPVGVLSYDVVVETGKQLRAEREATASMKRMGAAAEQLQAKFTVIVRAVQVYAAALAVLKLSQVADDFKLLQARVNVASDSVNAGAQAFDQLRKISTDTRSALEGNVQVFTRLNPSIKQMGGNANDTLRIVSLLSKAITVSGASAAEKTSAMIQFGQALGSGKLAGDELRSLLENAPYLMKQLADGLGVPIGALKSLGEQGKLTSDVVVNALSKAAAQINKDFAQFPETIASAMTVAKDEFTAFAELVDKTSPGITGAIKGVGEFFGLLAMQIRGAAKEGSDLNRNNEIATWAAGTTKVLSFVVDAADFVVRYFQVAGQGIYSLAMAAKDAATLDFAGAKSELADMQRSIEAVANAPYKGVRIRQQLEALDEPTGYKDRSDRLVDKGAPASKLKSAVDPEETRKLAAKRAAAQAYYEGLLADAQTGLARIDLEEQKALAENLRRSKDDKNNADLYARAKTAVVEKFARERAVLEESYAKETAAFRIAITEDEEERIEMVRAEGVRSALRDEELKVKTAEQAAQAIAMAYFQASQARKDLAERNARAEAGTQVAFLRDTSQRIAATYDEDVRRAQEALDRKRISAQEYEQQVFEAARKRVDDTRALEASRADFKSGKLDLRASTTGGADDRAAALKARAEKDRADALAQKELGVADEQAYADRIRAINEKLTDDLAQMRADKFAGDLAAASSAFSALTEAFRNESGKQDALYRAAFIAQKAFAVASAIVNIQAALGSAAASLPFPGNLGAMAIVAANTASIISTIRSTSYGGGRASGGMVANNSLVRINETGRPEVFTSGQGQQYLLPTPGGNVTPADQVGGANGGSAQRPIYVTQHFTVQQGTSTQTQQQMATAAARGLQQALARNG